MWTRRDVLQALGAAGFIGQPPTTRLTARQVVDRIKAAVGMPWAADTVDRIVAGQPETAVRGVATTMMATLAVLQRAAQQGRNLVISHEPTFWSHQDLVEPVSDDATYRAKRDFIDAHDLVVFHFHDHWHRMQPDGIALGMARALGWPSQGERAAPFHFALPPTTLEGLVAHIKTRLGVRSIRVVGDPSLRVSRVAASWGYASLLPRLIDVAARPDVDVIVVGETREWELVEYVQDQIAAGHAKALIVINHVASEQAGMAYCAEWLRPIVPEVPVTFIPADEPFW